MKLKAIGFRNGNWILFKADNLSLGCNDMPQCGVRAILPKDVKQIQEDKLEKPYFAENGINFTLINGQEVYYFTIPHHYDWDGASIPAGFRWIIGDKGSPQFLIPSMVHDYLCEHKDVIGRNRYLSSRVFRALLIACGTSIFKANLMFHVVDNYQKFMNWKGQNND